MGYSTDLFGVVKFDKQLTIDQKKQLEDFAEQRHGGNMDPDPDVPGFYCQWVPTEDGWGLEWDGGEKFYNYVEWLEHLIKKFFVPWGVKLNGEIEWEGEESGDLGKIIVKDNVVTTKEGKVVYEEEDEDERSGWWSIKFEGPEPSDSTLERIGGMIKDGYTSGDYYDKED
jgi:hypothetical protein